MHGGGTAEAILQYCAVMRDKKNRCLEKKGFLSVLIMRDSCGDKKHCDYIQENCNIATSNC